MNAANGRDLNRILRPTCSWCGSASIVWATVGERARLLDVAGESPGGWLVELSDLFGLEVGPDLFALECWSCPECDEGGVMGPVESGW